MKSRFMWKVESIWKRDAIWIYNFQPNSTCFW